MKLVLEGFRSLVAGRRVSQKTFQDKRREPSRPLAPPRVQTLLQENNSEREIEHPLWLLSPQSGLPPGPPGSLLAVSPAHHGWLRGPRAPGLHDARACNAPRSWQDVLRGGQRIVSLTPNPQSQGLQSPATQTPGLHDPGPEGRLPASPASLSEASQRVTRQGPGATTAEACGDPGPGPLLSARLRRSLQPTAASPAAPAASGPQALGWRKPEEGGAGTIPSPQPWRGSWRGRSAARSRRRPPARALPATPGSGSPVTARSASGAAGNASCSAVVATKFEKKGAVQIEAAGLPVPRGGEAGAQRSPYLSGGADNSRAPSSGVRAETQ
ncbi:spidroin-2-like [Marmota flaviventris]|uniref:spidroin-2-like n=1 Tax=Marmota flaviventris TaxID=93162 RepID=UPI003A887E33